MWPFAGRLGSAGAKEMNRLKPQRSRRVRSLGIDRPDVDEEVETGWQAPKGVVNTTVWMYDMIGFWRTR
jgi:hypothetical protein